MEREDLHAMLTQNNLGSGKSKCKEDTVFRACNESDMKTKKRLQRDTEDRKYCLGETIVLKEHKKMIIRNNQVTEEIFTVIDEQFH